MDGSEIQCFSLHKKNLLNLSTQFLSQNLCFSFPSLGEVLYQILWLSPADCSVEELDSLQLEIHRV